LALYRALGLTAPTYAHVGLLLDEAGERLAKRNGALTLHELRAAGVRPERVVGLIANQLGVTSGLEELPLPDLLAAFDPARHSCATATLRSRDLAWLMA
jgi:glutamyl-tRNA synthetase